MSENAVNAAAEAFGELFAQVYLRFHRRDAKKSELSSASRAVLLHLSVAGPLSVGEMSKHLDRAQSVVSEIVEHLERDGLLERMRDPRDQRRTLVWLSDVGVDLLARDREVLSRELLGRALARLSAERREMLLESLRDLLRADLEAPNRVVTHGRKRRDR